jgi:uncharacterized membrane protein
MKLNDAEKNARKAVEQLLLISNTKVTSTSILEVLCLHPDFPSVASISDALSEWGVQNIAIRLRLEQLIEIPMPALVYLTIRGGIFAVVKSIQHDTVTWFDTQTGWKAESLGDFNQKWDGIAILIDPNSQSGEADYPRKRQRETIVKSRLPLIYVGSISILAIIASLIWKVGTPVYLYPLLGLKIMGIALTVMLIWRSLDTENPFFQSLCKVGNKDHCNGILQSKAANLISWLSWSEFGFLYFAWGFLMLIFTVLLQNLNIPFISAIATLLALPYTFYSIYYQKFVARQWCKLCIAVQIVIWFETVMILGNLSILRFEWDVQAMKLTALALLVPVTLLAILKKPLVQSALVFGLRRELVKIKFNDDYISTVFEKQPRMPPIFEAMRIVTVGKLDAEQTITVVTNPLCGPCAKLHLELKGLGVYESDFRWQFVFIGPSKAMRVSSAFLNVSQDKVSILMDSWYSDSHQDIERWIKQNYVSDPGSDTSQQMNLHARWCELANITATPTIFVNGIQLPSVFNVKDIKRVAPMLRFGVEIV